MHRQVRTNPKSSPPDVDLLLSRLAEKNVNLAAVGGSDVEFGGEFAFVPEDGQEKTAFEVLDTWKYRYRVLRVDEDPELTLCDVDNTPGSLHACLAQVARDNLENGRIIRDLLIGIPDEKERAAGKIPVHIYSEQVRTSNSVGGR